MSDPTHTQPHPESVTPRAAGEDSSHSPAEDGQQTLEEKVIAVLRTVYDPEIPVNIYELGLIYKCQVDEATGKVDIDMTLTSPMCPVAGSLPGEVQRKILAVKGVTEAGVELVWDPPWSMENLSEEARLQLGML